MADSAKTKSSTERSKKSKPSPKNKNKPKQAPNKRDFYLSDTTPVAIQQESCEKLLETENGVIIHGVGPQISAAINLALQIERRRPAASVRTTVNTSTVYSIDESGERKPNSAVAISLLLKT